MFCTGGFDFCLSTSIPVLTTSTYVAAWPQGDQLLGGGPWHKANLPATHWLSLPFYTPEGAWRLSWQYPDQKRAPRWRLLLDQGPSRALPPRFFQRFLWDMVIFFQSSGLGSPSPLPSPTPPPPLLPPPASGIGPRPAPLPLPRPTPPL